MRTTISITGLPTCDELAQIIHISRVRITEKQQALLAKAKEIIGGIRLNGERARLEAPAPNSRRSFWRVVSDTESALFEESRVAAVLRENRGHFRTRELRKYAAC